MVKFMAIALALFCLVSYARGNLEADSTTYYSEELASFQADRMKREASPQGSLVIHGEQPLGGPDRRPSLDIDYRNRIYDRNGANANAYGGLNIRPGQAPQPHIGIQGRRDYRNGYIQGYGQAQRGPGGRIDPSFGVRSELRFRRDTYDTHSRMDE